MRNYLVRMMGIVVLSLVLTGCEGAESNDKKLDEKLLNEIFAVEDTNFYPGKMSWDYTPEEIIDSMNLAEDSYEVVDDGSILVRNAIVGLNEGTEGVLKFRIQEDLFYGIELWVISPTDENIKTVYEWGMEYLPIPMMNTEKWPTDETELMELLEKKQMNFSWNGEDTSSFGIDYLEQEPSVLQIGISRPVWSEENKIIQDGE